jgi:hypothetical protein
LSTYGNKEKLENSEENRMGHNRHIDMSKDYIYNLSISKGIYDMKEKLLFKKKITDND